MRHFLILVNLFISSFLTGQEPSYFTIGKAELAEIDIYDIYQDHSNNYWIASNSGIIKYDGYHFEKLNCENMNNSSVFNIREDANGAIYCNNLSGQIFKVANNQCKLYFQIPDSIMNHKISFNFDNQNQLILLSKGAYKCSSNGKIIRFIKDEKVSLHGNLFKDNNHALLIYSPKNKTLYTFKNDELNTEKVFEQDIIPSFFSVNNQLFIYDRKNQDSYIYKNKNLQKVHHSLNEFGNTYSNGNLFLETDYLGGGILYDSNYTALFNKNLILKDYILSKIISDTEGNILIGTLGNGIIVIPNLNSIRYPSIESPSQVCNLENQSIAVSNKEGNIFIKEDSTFVKVYNKGKKPIECLAYSKDWNSLIFNNDNISVLSLNDNSLSKYSLGALKDVFTYKNSSYLATHVGIIKLTKLNHEFKSQPLKGFDERTNNLILDTLTNTVYCGTSSGLKIGNEINNRYFRLNNNAVISHDFFQLNDTILCATEKNGILLFNKEKLINQWNYFDKENVPTIYKMIPYLTYFILGTNQGLFILNNDGTIFSHISSSFGLLSDKIKDLCLQNDTLFTIHNEGLQKFLLPSLLVPLKFPSLSIHKIKVNDKLINSDTIFNHTQNKFSFELKASTLKNQKEVFYEYKLDGIDDYWQTNTFNDNIITYKSLPFGNYTFKYRLKNAYKKGSILSYNFSIEAPFWSTWWFFLSSIIFTIFISYLVFRVQIKKNNKKIQLKNELNASKLIAIQSQMNPHFIFNAINSIQDLILQGDIDNSYSYIIKFSKLVRQTLNFSDKEFISIEEEIELLEIYLELEKLRFKDDFIYTIVCPLEDILVPPMLIQPFVENAIKHGLLHKEGQKVLEITFEKKENLNCIITDNGIGRKKAEEIKKRQKNNHQSFSVNATKQRFEIMKTHYKKDLNVEIIDLNHEGITGTKVIIEMPFIQKY